MTVSLSVTLSLTGTEQISASESPASGGTAGHERQYSDYNTARTLNANSSPVVDTVVDESRTMAGAAETIDLTAAKRAANQSLTVNCTGKRLVAAKLKADEGNNAAGVKIGPGATNGYNLFGAASREITLLPGMEIDVAVAQAVASPLPAVAAGAKDIDLAGAANDVLDLLFYFG